MILSKDNRQQLNDQLMAMAAHRYCMGRSSYIVSSCLEWLEETWGQFDRNTQRVMVRDTVEALMDDLVGSPSIDRPGWTRFAKWGFEQLCEEDKDWIRSAVAYKNKDWPI